MANYYIVGAQVQGEDLAAVFIDNSFWYADATDRQELIPQIQKGDRLAMKRWLGGADPTSMSIKAVGVVQDMRDYRYHLEVFRLIYVKWVPLTVERIVPAHGMLSAIHGPFLENDPKIAGVFSI